MEGCVERGGGRAEACGEGRGYEVEEDVAGAVAGFEVGTGIAD